MNIVFKIWIYFGHVKQKSQTRKKALTNSACDLKMEEHVIKMKSRISKF